MYRMPTVFGPAPGPRNVPREKSHLRYAKDWTVLDVVALTDPRMLSQLLPPRCKLDGQPALHVSMTYLTNIGWLAGRGYNILMVRIPAIFEGEQETVKGSFIPVLWENMTDPILTGAGAPFLRYRRERIYGGGLETANRRTGACSQIHSQNR
jgi:Acetoacetate decarboxylase (ADC)